MSIPCSKMGLQLVYFLKSRFTEPEKCNAFWFSYGNMSTFISGKLDRFGVKLLAMLPYRF